MGANIRSMWDSEGVDVGDDDDIAEHAVVVEDGGLLLDDELGKGDGVTIFGKLEHELHEILVADATDGGLGRADKIRSKVLFEVVGKEVGGRADNVLIPVPERDLYDPGKGRVLELFSGGYFMLEK